MIIKPEMTHIVAGLWLGNSYNAKHQPDLLREKDIKAILNVAWDLDYLAEPGPLLCKVGLYDGPGNSYGSFSLAVHVLSALHASTGNVLVHCHEGVSRSPTVVAAFLVKQEFCKDLDQAFNLIAERRPQINPKKPLVELARDYLAYKK
jgi:protein-tyrosine phosphatase